MAKKIYTDLDLVNAARVINLKDAVNPQDAATKAQLDAAIEGLNTKDNLRLASTANVNLAAPGDSLDGVNFTANDRFLVKDQTNKSENGIYVWNGPASPATRSNDGNTGKELLSAIATIDEGTANAGTSWRQTAVNITIGSTNILFTPFGVVSPPASVSTPGIIQIATQAEVDAGLIGNKAVTPATAAAYANRVKKVAAALGDGSATQFDVTHNLNTNDLSVQVYRTVSPFDNVECDVERPSLNMVRFRFSAPPSAGQFQAVIVG